MWYLTIKCFNISYAGVKYSTIYIKEKMKHINRLFVVGCKLNDMTIKLHNNMEV